MFNADDFLKAIKQASSSTLDSAKPTLLCFGDVISIKPLKIKHGQNLVLTEDHLILTNAVKDHDIKITIKTETESGGNPSHTHKIDKQKLKIKVHNSLKVGDKVIMIRLHGGQQYLVIDKEVKE